MVKVEAFEVSMPTVAELYEIVADVTRIPLSTVRMTARRMVDDELLPKGSGRRVPKVTWEEAALFLLVVSAGHPIKDASRTARTYAGLVKEGMAGGQTALEALVHRLRELPTDLTPTDWTMEVYTTFPQVVIKNPTIHGQHPSHSDRTDYGDFFIPEGEDRSRWPADAVMELRKFPGACLYDIARALKEDE
jgi:hypothetical protein